MGPTVRKAQRPLPVHLRDRARPGVVLALDRSRVAQLPARLAAQRRPVLIGADDLFVCAAFASGGTCPRGAACPDVHADVSAAEVLTPHVVRDPPL